MEDYKISPYLVLACAEVIQNNCDGGLQREGHTLHCLMRLASQKAENPGRGSIRESPLDDKCLAEVIITCFIGNVKCVMNK